MATLMDHLVYDWLRSPQPPLPGETDPQPPIFPDLLFSPEDIMLLRKAVVDGWPMPTTALWRKGPVGIPKERYGKSVLKRAYDTTADGLVNVQVIDWEANFAIFAKSYDTMHVNRVNQTILALDVDRYFDFDLSALYGEPFMSRAEFRLNNSDKPDSLLEDSDFRKFYISSDWTLTITIPVVGSASFIDRIKVYLDNVLIATVGGV
jgi:hypothetical protein